VVMRDIARERLLFPEDVPDVKKKNQQLQILFFTIAE
jgi:hypothetical protein